MLPYVLDLAPGSVPGLMPAPGLGCGSAVPVAQALGYLDPVLLDGGLAGLPLEAVTI